tara:strand:- start:1267 stop:1500 length:234 start_codon:yes stop_codon:yes gene_type:complete
MNRATALRERDVRRDAPVVSPGEFLRRYLASNFIETGAHPSSRQKEGMNLLSQEEGNSLKYMKKPRQGTTYDNPGGF